MDNQDKPNEIQVGSTTVPSDNLANPHVHSWQYPEGTTYRICSCGYSETIPAEAPQISSELVHSQAMSTVEPTLTPPADSKEIEQGIVARPALNADTILKVEEVVEEKRIGQPKQVDHPNLNAGNSTPDNNFAEKWKTPEERILACEKYCEYLRKGRSKAYYPEADENTITRYIKKYPNEFRTEKIEDAERQGMAYIEGIGFRGMTGKIDKFNAVAWIFLTKNKLGWRDKQDITTDNQQMNTVLVYKPQKNEE